MPHATKTPPDVGSDKDESSKHVRAVQRAILVLRQFDRRHFHRSLAELTELTGLPKSTVVRLLATLEVEGLVAVYAEGEVYVGAALTRWASLAHSAWGQPIQSVLDKLAAELGDTVQLQWRQGDTHRRLVAQALGPQSLRYEGNLGDGYELWRGAAAEVLFGNASEEMLHRLATLSKGRVTVDVLCAQARDAAHKGYALTEGVREAGVAGLAVPIRDSEAVARAALVVVGPVSRIKPLENTEVERLKDAALEIEKELHEVGTLR